MNDVTPNLKMIEHCDRNHAHFAASHFAIGCNTLQRRASFHKNEHVT